MPVNEFEKQVQQKMDELKFPPSAEVWMEVEKRIRKEKKRRFIFLWWLIPALLLGGGAVYFMNNNSEKERISLQMQPAADNVETDPSTVQAAPQNKKAIDYNNDTPSAETRQNTEIVNRQQPNTSNISQPDDRSSYTSNPQPEITASKPPVAKKKKTATTVVKETMVKPAENSLPATTGIATGETKPQPLPVIETDAEQNNKQETVQVVQAQTDSVVAAEVLKEKREEPVTSVKPPHTEEPKKWKLGAGLQAGASNTWWGSLFDGRQESFNATPQSNVGSGTGVNQPVYIAAPKSGLSFGVELYAQKSFSSKLDLRLGIQYSYMSNHIKTGSRVDSTRQVFNSISDGLTVSNYYRPPGGNAQRDYTNRYHMAGISAALSWKIIDGQKFSLSWDNGLSVSRLLSTNALHYDRNLQAYYQDFKPFRKTQLFISTGLSVPVIRAKGFSMSANPFASYGLTPVLKRNYSISSHYVQYGMGLKFQFPSQK